MQHDPGSSPSLPQQPSPPWEQQPQPAPSAPSRLPRPFTILGALLALSLLANLVLAVRAQDSARRAEQLREILAAPLASPAATATATATGTGSAPAGPILGDGPIDRIAKAVARLRGLAFKGAINAEVLTPAELRRRVDEQFRKDQPRGETENSEKVLKALGLLAADDDLYDILLEVHTEQVAGYYDNVAKKLVVGGSIDNLSPYDRVILAHELTHAVTDQHFGLSRLDRLDEERKDDEATAYLSLVEGDAVMMMRAYLQTVLTEQERSAFNDEAEKIASPRLDAAPAVIRKALLFPYDAGFGFVQRLYDSGGTAAVDAAYRNPPTSTEQIIHPERFFRRDDPQEIRMPDLRRALGDGWKTIDSGGAGELDVQIIADQFLADSEATTAADGWDGGRYEALESASGQVLIALPTLWDSPEEAAQAADALSDWLRPRFGNRGNPYRDGGAYGWEAPGAAGEVLRSGSSVVLVIGPDRASVTRARRAFAA